MMSTFSTLSNEEPTDQCAALSSTIQCDGHSDLDEKQLAHEFLYLPDMPSKKWQFIHQKELAEIYPNQIYRQLSELVSRSQLSIHVLVG